MVPSFSRFTSDGIIGARYGASDTEDDGIAPFAALSLNNVRPDGDIAPQFCFAMGSYLLSEEPEGMQSKLDISNGDGLADIESNIARVTADLPQEEAKAGGLFRAKLSKDRRASYFKDIWAAIAVASGIDHFAQSEVTAWGIKDWSKQIEEDGFALSYPSLVAIQRGARILTDSNPPEPLDQRIVMNRISRARGVLGRGARQRTVVELDPDLPLAAPLANGANRRENFFYFVRDVLSLLEIGALARKGVYRENPAKGAILEFLYELHSNAFEHGRRDRSVRFLRLQKHQYPRRDVAARHASQFLELQDYIAAQDERPSAGQFNLVEASVSDFGSGILDGFLSTFAGRAYSGTPRRELLDKLLHEQLSSKSSDPNAGLGIGQALAAARDLGAFVSLRTGEFWLTMSGKNEQTRMSFRHGAFAKVAGTHWQLLLRDPTDDASIRQL